MEQQKQNRLDQVMRLLGVRAITLSNESGADHSLITKWRRGERTLTRRSEHLVPVAEALLRLDTNHALDDVLAPYRLQGESAAEALCTYLTSKELSALPPQAAPGVRQTTGDYIVQYRVYLGHKGFRKAALTMLDYIQSLPPGREITVVCNANFEWFISNIPFVLQFVERLRKAIARGTKLVVVARRGYTVSQSAAFAGPWLLAHLKGYVRSLYYDEDPHPGGDSFLATIPGYWGARVREDAAVEDNLYASMHTDPVEIAREEALCYEYRDLAKSASQYNFFTHPEGTGEDKKLWEDGPLPQWDEGYEVDGSFYVISRVPSFGLITRAELDRATGGEAPKLPGYLFPEEGDFGKGRYRIILCRDDIREGLAKTRRAHEVLSDVYGRRVFMPQQALVAQVTRLLQAMDNADDVQVALIPRSVFYRMYGEMICWKHSASVGWLQDMSQSVFACDRATSGSFHGALGFTWDRLMTGWKRQEKVKRQLRKWLAGKDLEKTEPDSAMVRNWMAFPQSGRMFKDINEDVNKEEENTQ